jgi:hypothetical protein
MKAWYYAPALQHYRCIKAVTDTGAVRLTDTFKFLHHTIPTPKILDTDRIIKATQHLQLAIEGKRDAPPDELDAIRHLHALITGAANTPPVETPDPKPIQAHETPDPPPEPAHAPKPVPSPSTQTPAAAPIENTAHQPHHIPFDNNEYT